MSPRFGARLTGATLATEPSKHPAEKRPLMGYGLTTELQLIAIGLFAACTFVASRELPFRLAALIAAIRVVIVIGYFAWYYDGTWTTADDLVYTAQGQTLIDRGENPLLIFTPKGVATLQSLAGSSHILYTWWTLTWMWLLGAQYYAPVVANVFLTFVSAHVLARLMQEIGFSRSYRTAITAFYLLHWDTIAWSSFISFKDCHVQLLTMSAFLFAIRFYHTRSVSAGILLACNLLLFGSIRFYLPALMAAAAGIWLLLESRDSIRFLLFAGGGLSLAALGPWHYFVDQLNPLLLFRDVLRFALTPQPWSIQRSYSFLYLPALAHFIFFVPALIGTFLLCLKHPFLRLFAWYAMVVLLFYAAIDELQGVRHRTQLSFLFAWAQFHFLWQWTNASLPLASILTRAAARQPRIQQTTTPFLRSLEDTNAKGV